MQVSLWTMTSESHFSLYRSLLLIACALVLNMHICPYSTVWGSDHQAQLCFQRGFATTCWAVFSQIYSQISQVYKMRPPICFCFRGPGAPRARPRSRLCLCSSSLHHGHSTTRANGEREETGQTLLLSIGVIDSWVSRTLIPPGDNTKAPSPPAGNLTPILCQKESKSSVRHSLTLTDTFLCPCFTFRKVGGGNLTITWKYIVCNNHWESSRHT